MIFTLPMAFYLLFFSITLILLYWQIKQKQKIEVSALFLWQEKAGKPKRFTIPKQKFDLLLLLQLIILLLLVLSLAKPAISTQSNAEGLILILDGSVSMRKINEDKTEIYSRAKEQALSIINDFSFSKINVIQFSSKTKPLSSSTEDLDDTKKKIKGSDPTFYSDGSSEKLRGILEKAEREGFQRGVILSDKNWEVSVPGMEINQKAWKGSTNLSITDFSIRENPRGDKEYSIFARISNFSEQDLEGKFTLSSNEYIEEREFTLKGNRSKELVFRTKAEKGEIYKARLKIDDGFSLDNIRYAVTQEYIARNIGWIGKRNNSLIKAIKASWPLATIRPYAPMEYDLIICNGSQISDNLSGKILLINSAMQGLIDFKGELRQPELSISSGENSLIKGVDLSSLSFASVPEVEINSSIEPILLAEDSPLLFHKKSEESEIVGFTPSLENTNLTSKIDFPILIHNILNWLSPHPNKESIDNWNNPGEIIDISKWGKIEYVVSPGGEKLKPEDNLFTPSTPGIYTLHGSTKDYSLPVNISAEESKSSEKTGNQLKLESRSFKKNRVLNPLWPIFAIASIVLLMIESLLYYGDFYRWLS